MLANHKSSLQAPQGPISRSESGVTKTNRSQKLSAGDQPADNPKLFQFKRLSYLVQREKVRF